MATHIQQFDRGNQALGITGIKNGQNAVSKEGLRGAGFAGTLQGILRSEHAEESKWTGKNQLGGGNMQESGDG